MPPLWIGLISGTSADAVDAALVDVTSPTELELVDSVELPVEDALREKIHETLQRPVELRDLVELDRKIGERFADAALEVARRAGVEPGQIEGIGSHGQTLGHFPEEEVHGTLQIGSPSVIHERTGIPVVADFRAADMAAGGQGAPLTPFLHSACLGSDREARAVLNIGGFTNVSFLSRSGSRSRSRQGDVVAFDPGPGNALLDRAARAASGLRFDAGGESASRGRVYEPALGQLLADPYFAKAPPKSTGHEYFGQAFFERARDLVTHEGGNADDLMATLVALSVGAVVEAARCYAPEPPVRWIVYGGGTQNTALMSALADQLAPAEFETSDAYGLPAGSLEAVAFALLGYCGARGLPSNVPAATGARRAVALGAVTPPGSLRAVT